MDKEQLIKALQKIAAENPDGISCYELDEEPENWHRRADAALLKCINDPEITELFGNVEKWYNHGDC